MKDGAARHHGARELAARVDNVLFHKHELAVLQAEDVALVDLQPAVLGIARGERDGTGVHTAAASIMLTVFCSMRNRGS